MEKITYKHLDRGYPVDVYLGDKKVGQIRLKNNGWIYFPRGKKQGGSPFDTLGECMKSLESE